MTALKPGTRIMVRPSKQRFGGLKGVVQHTAVVGVSSYYFPRDTTERYQSYVVELNTGAETTILEQVYRKDLWLLCKNCNRPRHEHAKQKKCLYEATHWRFE